MMFRVVFWDILPCKMIVDRRFRGAYCLDHQGWVSLARKDRGYIGVLAYRLSPRLATQTLDYISEDSTLHGGMRSRDMMTADSVPLGIFRFGWCCGDQPPEANVGVAPDIVQSAIEYVAERHQYARQHRKGASDQRKARYSQLAH
jgi:hypothetical protein